MREGSSIAAPKASAVSWPTPGMVISRRQAADALVIRLMSASIAATAVITAVRAVLNPRMAAERPATPSLAQGHPLANQFLRALISERRAWARNDFTGTGLKKPVRAKSASPRASLRSVLWVAGDLSAW